MSLNAYEIVKCIVEEKSFASAAEIVNLTPSAISRSVRTLEEQWGFPLFVRTKTGVHLTPEGEKIYPFLCDVLNSENILSQQAAQIRGVEEGVVRVAALGSVCHLWLPSMLRSFAEKHPNIGIQIFEGETNDILEMVLNNTADIGFVALPCDASVDQIPLYEDPLYCVTAKDYFPDNKHYVTIDDLRDMSFVTPHSGYDLGVQNFWNKHNLKPKYSPVAGDNAILAMVASGLGTSICPGMYLEQMNYDVEIYPIVPAEFRTIGIITRQSPLQAPAITCMTKHILRYMKENGIMNIKK